MDIRIFTLIMTTTKISPTKKGGNRAQRRAKSRSKKKAFIKTYASLISDTKNSSVARLIELITGEKVEADLNFQSRTRWSLEDMQSYITSLIIGMAPSKFIFAATASCLAASQNGKDKDYYQWWVGEQVDYLNIDSNNRINSIRKFVNNEFGIEPGIYLVNGQSITVEAGVNDTFDKLDSVLKMTFLNAKVTLEVILSATRKQLSEQFIRMNQGIYLNGPEKRNAVISPFSDEIRELTTDHMSLLCPQYISEKEASRRKADDFLAGLCLLYQYGHQYKITEKSLWSAYDEKSTINETIFTFCDFFDNFAKAVKPYVGILPNKNSIIDMVCIIKDMEDQGRFLQDKKGFFTEFSRVHALLLNDKKFYPVSDDKVVTYQGLLRSRESKYNSLRRILLEGGGEYQLGEKKSTTRDYYPTDKSVKFDYEQFFSVERDSQRTFTKEQKLVAAWEQDFTTPEGKPIEFDDLLNPDKIQGGHDKPWADGGSTTQDNLKLQTKEDNLKLGKKSITDSEEPVE